MAKKKGETAVILASTATIHKMRGFYDDCMKEKSNPYLLFEAKNENCSILAYEKTDKDGNHKVVFQGENAAYEAKIWGTPEVAKQKATTAKKAKPVVGDQIGSDEVGTGDFFGPVCVVACYVRQDQFARLKELGVTDSKALTDEQILALGPTLIREFDYVTMTVDNEKYNEVHKTNNMNAIKAKLHNAALAKLKARHLQAEVCVDQFCLPATYYGYIKYERTVVEGIRFSTKGELAFPSVAAASCIARYSFLRKMKALSEKYDMDIPFGAGEAVDEFAKEFVKRYGLEEIKKVTKGNFKNMERLLA